MKSATVILVALLLAAPMALGAQHRALKSGARKLSATKAPPPADYSSPPTMDYSPPGGYGGSGSGTGADYQGGSGGSVDYAPAGAPSAVRCNSSANI